MHYFITAIGTDSGKTVASAIITEALKADYWKPVQCGYPTDSETVKSLLSNSETTIHEETYLLETPASPHIASANLNIEIYLNLIKTNFNTLIKPTVIEGAGGVLVPLNDNECVIDIPKILNIPVILVANLYLGSINHTLLTIEELKRRSIEISGIIFNGEDPQNTKEIILKKSELKELLHIQKEEKIDQSTILKYAELFRNNFK